MASVSSLGMGSNLNLGPLMDKLSAAEKGRLTPLTNQQTSYKAKLTAWSVERVDELQMLIQQGNQQQSVNLAYGDWRVCCYCRSRCQRL